jgi:hypothetical protein
MLNGEEIGGKIQLLKFRIRDFMLNNSYISKEINKC